MQFLCKWHVLAVVLHITVYLLNVSITALHSLEWTKCIPKSANSFCPFWLTNSSRNTQSWVIETEGRKLITQEGGGVILEWYGGRNFCSCLLAGENSVYACLHYHSCWVQENCLHYLTIFTTAMYILPIQGSSIPSNWVFSSAKETLTNSSNYILPELMEGLQMLKYSVKHGHSMNFPTGSSWDDEKPAMEKLITIEGNTPKNHKAYAHKWLGWWRILILL